MFPGAMTFSASFLATNLYGIEADLGLRACVLMRTVYVGGCIR